MFQQLSQGAVLPIFFRNNPRVEEGRVISVNTHMPTFNPSQPFNTMSGPVTDITVQVGNDTIPFAGLPANGVTANFPDKGMFISTDKAAVVREVDTYKAALRQDLASVPEKQKTLQQLEALSLELEPGRKLEIQKAQEMEVLKQQVTDMGSKFDALSGRLDQLIGALSANVAGTSKNEK